MKVDGRVLVTGAGGFIGGRVVERLALDEAATPVAGIHRLSNAARVGRFDVDIRQVDVTDPASLHKAMEGCQYVVHCAYGSPDATTTGTRNVLEIAEESDVERVVHLSTIEVYGDEDGIYDESSEIRHSGRDYADSKVDAERICWEFVTSGSVLDVVVLRPAIVYGPFAEEWTINPVRRLQSGRWGDSAGLDGICNPVYVDDVVQAVDRGLVIEEASGEAYNVTGGDTLTWNDYYRRINERISHSHLPNRRLAALYLWSSMVFPFRWVGQRAMSNHEDAVMEATSRSTVFKQIARYVRDRIQECPSLSELRLYRRQATYPIDKARNELDYDPRFDLDDGFDLSVAWLRHHGFVDVETVDIESNDGRKKEL